MTTSAEFNETNLLQDKPLFEELCANAAFDDFLHFLLVCNINWDADLVMQYFKQIFQRLTIGANNYCWMHLMFQMLRSNCKHFTRCKQAELQLQIFTRLICYVFFQQPQMQVKWMNYLPAEHNHNNDPHRVCGAVHQPHMQNGYVTW